MEDYRSWWGKTSEMIQDLLRGWEALVAKKSRAMSVGTLQMAIDPAPEAGLRKWGASSKSFDLNKLSSTSGCNQDARMGELRRKGKLAMMQCCAAEIREGSRSCNGNMGGNDQDLLRGWANMAIQRSPGASLMVVRYIHELTSEHLLMGKFCGGKKKVSPSRLALASFEKHSEVIEDVLRGRRSWSEKTEKIYTALRFPTLQIAIERTPEAGVVVEWGRVEAPLSFYISILSAIHLDAGHRRDHLSEGTSAKKKVSSAGLALQRVEEQNRIPSSEVGGPESFELVLLLSIQLEARCQREHILGEKETFTSHTFAVEIRGAQLDAVL
ncbi:hypothetical protein BDK51DRAFT_27153 [Blyttiomyces helicus]|uniref:Uncharacterized protein n=1 Tax=Blyttiomyces helicus TaxID=388810 RepID=A0A4P9WPG8_9FUNG|nr:hypothetical protein BDK51DRAFT_27153 [Blyttiomyces helicus]|eukprot:RKO93140.1 hypothetical protein BDK51DRAFT_27153 [Blyttiomyces helicus]